jgi:tetratricopeptide (TPR) repeat protein
VISMDMFELLERYQALGELDDYLAAKPLFERAIAGRPTAHLLKQYGYLLECHGRITIRRAIEQYERSIELDPAEDQVRLQWIGAKASLGEPETAIDEYRARVAAAPGDLRELRFLVSAYLSARDFAAAAGVIGAGLEIAPDDWAMIMSRGSVREARGDAAGALADWRRALELDPEILSPVYASAFLLEREGRLAEAAACWRHIIGHAEAHGWELTTVWPRQELQRVEGLLAGASAAAAPGGDGPAGADARDLQRQAGQTDEQEAGGGEDVVRRRTGGVQQERDEEDDGGDDR